MGHFYIAIDGDDVGRRIERLIVNNQTHQLSKFSTQYEYAMDWLEKILESNLKTQTIFKGGDSLFAICSEKQPFAIKSSLEALRKDFYNLSKMTLSMGIGSSPREAYFALKLAKAQGKNRIILFSESLESDHE